MLGEEVTICAARGVGKVLLAIGVAVQARLARGARRIAMAGVTALAGLVLGLRM